MQQCLTANGSDTHADDSIYSVDFGPEEYVTSVTVSLEKERDRGGRRSGSNRGMGGRGGGRSTQNRRT